MSSGTSSACAITGCGLQRIRRGGHGKDEGIGGPPGTPGAPALIFCAIKTSYIPNKHDITCL